jgi:lysophospholipase L1-like esterase
VLNSWYDGNAPAPTANVTLRIAGDSTACIFPPTDPTMRVGWGQVFQQDFAGGVTVDDEAQSGRSSKSFIDEGFWAALKAKIVPGDYVFIEFGHNDESADPTLYTDPATTYQDYLRIYVDDTRAAGGFPVLLTPIARAEFSATMVKMTHGSYPAAMINLAELTGTPVIDMTTRTTVWLTALGPTAALAMFAVGDDTHLSAMGAPQVAALVADGMRDLQLPIAADLVPAADE